MCSHSILCISLLENLLLGISVICLLLCFHPTRLYILNLIFVSLLLYSQFSSVHFSCSVMSDSLQLHEPQHARPASPSPNPRVYSNSCGLSQWCHPTISSSVIPFSFHLQSFLESRSFQISELFTSGGQLNGVSVSTSVFPRNTQGWSLGLTGWISLQPKGLSSLLQHHSSKASILRHSGFFIVQLSHPYSHPRLWKNHSLD